MSEKPTVTHRKLKIKRESCDGRAIEEDKMTSNSANDEDEAVMLTLGVPAAVLKLESPKRFL